MYYEKALSKYIQNFNIRNIKIQDIGYKKLYPVHDPDIKNPGKSFRDY